MNKLNLLLLAGAAALASCASEDVINSGDINPSTGGQAMSFGVLTGNHSRANLDAAGHKDFGVFAYKGTDMAAGLVMKNYQVKHEAAEKYGSLWQYDQIPNQVLKYWDYSFDNHYFVAYTPYAAGVTLTANDAATADLKSTLVIPNAVSFWTMAERDNKEAMWCTQTVAKSRYGQEVPLIFNHLNAVVRLAFRSNIPGYTVELINLVPTATTVTGIDAIQYGVQLTPATAEQKGKNIGWEQNQGDAQPEIDQEYATNVNFTVADVFAVAPTITTAVNTKSKANLVFNLGETTGAAIDLPINNGADAEYTPLGSQYFALPLSDYSSYTTGYTLHVSYVLKPTDGAANTTVYDARVFIPADACQWAYGKSYLYRFTITTASTGVTDPNTIIYNGSGDSTGSPYVDPTDPRVSGNALRPIVFDGVTVTDYTAAADSDHNIN